MIGQLLTGRYLILENLGKGGFSETYLARDKYLPHHPLCVVKCLKLSSQNKISLTAAQELFESEASLLEQLGQQHSQIPTLLAYCHEEDQVYLVQEYIEGENLGRWFAQGKRLSFKASLKLLMDILPVLDYMHSHGVIHRDIKPSNLIRRRRDGKVVVIDFGAACLCTEAEFGAKPSVEEADALAIGTPGYMPEEQQAGRARLNSDLYALGVSMIHLITGIHPRKLQKHPVSGELDWHRFLSKRPSNPKLVTILDRMVRMSGRDRYRQASDVLADLEALSAKKKTGQGTNFGNWQRIAQQTFIPVTSALVISILGGSYVYAHSQRAGSWLNQMEQQFSPPTMQLKQVRDMGVQAGIKQMAIAPNNQVLVTANIKHNLHLWSLSKGTLLKSLSQHRSPITALAISRDSQFLVSGDQKGTLYLWDMVSGELQQELKPPETAPQGLNSPKSKADGWAVRAIAIDATAQTLVSGHQDGTIHHWNLSTGRLQQTLKLPKMEITAVAYGATPNSLISASLDSTHPESALSSIQVWELNTGKLRRMFAGHMGAILDLKVTNDQTLFSFGKDRGLMWNLNREELAFIFPKNSANPSQVSLTEQDILTVHDNGAIHQWKRHGNQWMAEKAGSLGKNLNLALSPDHQYLASWGMDQQLRIWQLNAAAR
jgi:serine/threonine protein kinase